MSPTLSDFLTAAKVPFTIISFASLFYNIRRDVRWKGVKKGSNSAEVERLSELPGEILQYILGFLETKESVQTSVLSTIWRNLWSGVPVLDFYSNSFTELRDFKKFVRKVLRRRDGNSPVRRLKFHYRGARCDKGLVNMIIYYAISYNVHHLHIRIQPLSWTDALPSKLFQHQNLETLQLTGFEFIKPLRCTKLTSLRLTDFWFYDKSWRSFNILSGSPNLNNLCLSNCKFDFIKISAPQLRSLTINNLWGSNHRRCKGEISAPKVTYFRCREAERMDFSVINLPSLQHADLDWSESFQCQRTLKDYDNLVKLFEGISYVQSLTLSSSTIKALAEVHQDWSIDLLPFVD